MAYNPFSIFRRNQKALFAVLTVFIMIMFTLSFGRGDFFEQIPRWLGNRGAALCTLDGHKVTATELQTLDHKRKIANQFMSLAASQITNRLQSYVIEQQQNPKLGPEGKEIAGQALSTLQRLGDPRTLQQLPLLIAELTQKIESPTTKSEDKEVARAAQVMYQLLYKTAIGGRSHYFLNAPNRNDRDLIEFLIWQKKADALGVTFTHADVGRLIQAEFSGFYKADVEIQARKMMQQTPGFTMEACLDALAAEFKVRAAQVAVLGQGSRFHRAPAYPTPYEAFEYYREQCSPTVYEVIPVPAAGFVAQVKGQPSDAEVKELFDKYQNEEPNPKSETPGFKQPRKIAVEWIGVTGEEPYYKKLAEQQVKVGEVMAKASGALTVPLPGAAAQWAAAAAAPLSLKEPAVAAAYNSQVERFEADIFIKYGSPTLYARDILPSSVVRPGVLAATAGGFVGQAAGCGSPLAAVALAMGAPVAYEIRDRVKVGLPLVLGAMPGPAMLPTALAGVATARANEPKPLPAGYLRPELLKTVVELRAKELAFRNPRPDPLNPTAAAEKGDVPRFIEELGKMAAEKKDKAAIEKYVQDFITSRGIAMHGKSTEPRSEWHLEDDPGLQPLVRAQKESLKQAGGFHSNRYIPFGQSFFWTTAPARSMEEVMNPRRGPATSGDYQATMYPPGAAPAAQEGKPHYIVWRTEDIKPQSRTLDAARPAVVAAWKLIKARELARAHANAIAEQIRAAQMTDPILLNQYLREQAEQLRSGIADPKARDRVKPFTISGVAQMVPDNSPMMMLQGGGQLQPYELKASENIAYPTPEMRKELLDNRDKPVKTTFVMADAPKDTFYITTLMHREVMTLDDFRRNVYSGFGTAQEVRLLYQEEAMRNSRKSVLELLKKEFKYEETEEQKKKLEDNAKSATRE